MYKQIIILSFVWLKLNGIEKPEKDNFLLDRAYPITLETIKEAHSNLLKLPMSKMVGGKKMLSQTLFLLCERWSDEWGDEGLEFAKMLIAKGADPFYSKTFGQVVELDVPDNKTAIGIAHGKLLIYLRKQIN